MHKLAGAAAAALIGVMGVATAVLAQAPEPNAPPPPSVVEPAQTDPSQALTKALSEVPTAPPETAPPKTTARYSFDRVDGAILRLDTVSGRLTACSQSSAGWVCQTVPEDRAALEKEIGRLQAEVTDLKSQLAALREPPPPPRPPADLAPPPNAAPKSTLKLPSHEDIERARSALERAWRRLVDMINDFQRDMTKG